MERESRSCVNDVELHAFERALELFACLESSKDTIANNHGTLAYQLIVQKVNGIFGATCETVVVLWDDKDVPVVLGNLSTPGDGVRLGKRALGGDHCGHDRLVKDGEVEVCDVYQGDLGVLDSVCVACDDFIDDICDMRAHS
ncbi:hypothetical protein HG530_014967 [Fusarium avenaceum]|nr:hypothetical protein HG530_014967 [Fusarium avenaceum]